MHNDFDTWKARVSHELKNILGCTIEETPSFDWWKLFNNGATPAKAVGSFLRSTD